MGMDDGLSDLADLADLSRLLGWRSLGLVVRLQESSAMEMRMPSILVSLAVLLARPCRAAS
jgi:hypothetical protein